MQPFSVLSDRTWLMRDVVLLVLGGGIAGTLLDQIHVQSGTLQYRAPELAGQAWWVLPQFALLLAAVVWTSTLIVARTRPRADTALEPVPGRAWTRPPLMRIVVDATWFAFAYAISAAPATVFDRDDETTRVVVLVVLALIAAIRLVLRGDRRVALVALGLTIGGPAYEATISSLSWFWYHDADLLGVPLWLPALYACGAPLAASVGMLLDAHGRAARARR